MKTFKIFSIITICLAMTNLSFAQTEKTEKIRVAGECGMCKDKIEKAAKSAGASYALWDVDAKVLTVTFSDKSTNTAKIQKKIAAVGYDTPDFKATDKAYNKLHGCCKYDRSISLKESTCCTEACKAICEEMGCCGESCCQPGCCSGEKEGTSAGAKACCKKEEGKSTESCGKSCCKKSEQ